MKLKLIITVENDETGEVLGNSESYGWSANARGMFEAAEEEMGKLERYLGVQKNIQEAEEYMERVADEQIKVSGHVK